jgi:probable blue pigment (indigoidine) exporter
MGFLATPVVGLIAGALILGESLGPIDIAGFALVLGGIAAASLVPPKAASETLPAADVTSP